MNAQECQRLREEIAELRILAADQRDELDDLESRREDLRRQLAKTLRQIDERLAVLEAAA